MINSTHYVTIGEYKIGKSPEILKATLGSCVGIAFLWKEKDIYGLVHCLLPESPPDFTKDSAKYVSTAIPLLINKMGLSSVDHRKIEVHVAGGGDMLQHRDKNYAYHVGEANATLAMKLLRELRFKVKVSDLGGNFGRYIILNCQNGIVEIKAIPNIN